MLKPILVGAGCIPVAVLAAAVFFERWRRKSRGERPPLSEKLLRPVGYDLQCKIEDAAYICDTLMTGAFFSSLLAVGVLQFEPNDHDSPHAFFIVFALISAGCTFMAWRKLMEIRQYRRGLLGEQAVAEQLQFLLPKGYQVFHDVPSDEKWNIDHVVVGPAGIFAIETKYRTKRPGKTGARDHEATFDGVKIQFPSGYDAKAPEQARANARWLANMLSKATGEHVTVQPIVVLPGWWVTLKANSDVKVLSGKQISGFISTEHSRLSPETIQRVSYQLEQRCRSIEF